MGAPRCRVPQAHDVSSFSMVWLVLRGVCPGWRVAVLLPMALTLGPDGTRVHPHRVRRPPHSGVLAHDVVSPSPRTPRKAVREGGGLHVDTPPPSHAITRRGTRCQSKERPPQLTPTNPSQTVHPRQSGAPAEPERNHTTLRQDTEPAAAVEAAEQGNTERPADTSDGSATNGGPPRTNRRTERAEEPRQPQRKRCSGR